MTPCTVFHVAFSQRSTVGWQGWWGSRYPGSHRNSTSVPDTALFVFCRPHRVAACVCAPTDNGGQYISSASASSFSKSEKIQWHPPSTHAISGVSWLMHNTGCTHTLCRRCIISVVFHHALICQYYRSFFPPLQENSKQQGNKLL